MSLVKNPTRFPENESHFLLEGSVGSLEVHTTSHKPWMGIGVICHPHPLYGGSMNNKVVYTLSEAMKGSGLNTVRFNFRGVGKSEGAFGDVAGEVEDLFSVLEWIQKVCPTAPLWLAGFSFGAYVCAKGAEYCLNQDWDLRQLISIAPAVHLAPYPSLNEITCPWLIIQGTEDELIPSDLVLNWAKTLQLNPNQQVKYIPIPGASHFFHGKLLLLQIGRASCRERVRGLLGMSLGK